MSRIGVLGGSFDPVHIGHLWMGVFAFEQLRLDALRIVPAAHSPLKPERARASDEHRVSMLRLAISGTPGWSVDTTELERGGVSYTVDTLAAMREANASDDEWFFIMGADSLASIAAWREPTRLMKLATLSVVRRGGQPPLDYSVLEPFASADEIAKVRRAEVSMPAIELSSSEIRRRVAKGQSIRFLIPRAVEAMIQAERMYHDEA